MIFFHSIKLKRLFYITKLNIFNLLICFLPFRNMQINSNSSSLPSQDAQTIFVGGLKPHLTKAHLNKHFKKDGDIVSIFLKTDPHTKLNKGFAFLVFKEVSSVEKVLSQPQIICGREVECRLSLQNGNNSFVKKEVSKSRLFVRCLAPDQTSAD